MSRHQMEELEKEARKEFIPFVERLETIDREGEEFLRMHSECLDLQKVRNKYFAKIWPNKKFNQETREMLIE